MATLKKVEDAKEAVAMAHSASKNQLWVADQEGLVHILAADTL